MKEPNEMTATEAAAAIEKNAFSTRELLAACEERIRQREVQVGAWQALDWNVVERQLRELESNPSHPRARLWGLPVAVKDIFDTFDLPTTYGSRIYENHRPAADAACVARLRAAGAIVMGKTVSTEFAFWQAGKTRNPLSLAHSPGGSSSGSAAAVADCMSPLAIGSQTAASTIRPAAYCGIVGFKPTIGLISLAGVKALANSLDTVGVFGRTVADAALIASVMIGSPELAATGSGRAPRGLRIWNGPELTHASDDARGCIETVADLCSRNAIPVDDAPLPEAFCGLLEAQTTLMSFEANRELAHEKLHSSELLSSTLRTFLDSGAAVSLSERFAAIRLRDTCLATLDALFGDADIVVLPSAPDTAPPIDSGTGDPVMSRAFTLLGLPSISLPCGSGENGLPLGVQIAARPMMDRELLSIAAWMESRIGR